MNEKYLYKNIENKKVKELINRIPNEIKNNCKIKKFEKINLKLFINFYIYSKIKNVKSRFI